MFGPTSLLRTVDKWPQNKSQTLSQQTQPNTRAITDDSFKIDNISIWELG